MSKRSAFLTATLSVALVLAGLSAPAAKNKADLVLINGNIWSLHMYNGKVTLQRWTKSCKPKAKAPKKDI